MRISLGGITDNKHNKYFRIEGRLAIMNISKFTQKSVEAVQNCEKLAYEYGNQEIEQEHLLVALMRQERRSDPEADRENGDLRRAFHG